MINSDSPFSTQARIDKLGIGLAGLCAMHCLATVIIVTGLGAGGHFFLAPDIHRVGLALAVIIAAAAIGWGAMRHRRMAPSAVAVSGLSLMTLALFVPHGNNEFLLTFIGVALVAWGHVLNLRARARP